MNKSKKHLLRTMVSALLACVGFISCSQDELTEQGTPLPVGQYPLELTADGVQAVAAPAQPATRGTFFEGDWSGVTGVKVRVNDKEEKEYSVTPSEDKKTAHLAPAQPLESTDELFWWTSSKEEKTIMAWAPYEYTLNKKFTLPTEWKKEDFDKFDIIGVQQTIGFEDRNKPLRFQHMMAKVVINLQETEYLKAAKDIKVQLLSMFKSGTVRINPYTNNLEVYFIPEAGVPFTPYLLPKEDYKGVNFGDKLLEKPFASYMTLVIPADLANLNVLQIEVDDAKYILRKNAITNDLGVYYRAGQVTTFNITIKENGLQASMETSSIGWDYENGATGNGEVELP